MLKEIKARSHIMRCSSETDSSFHNAESAVNVYIEYLLTFSQHVRLVFGRFLKALVTICKLLTDPNTNSADVQVQANWTLLSAQFKIYNNNLHLLLLERARASIC